VEVKSKQQN